MNLKRSIGLLAHRILDKRAIVNPITSQFYPELYRKRKIHKAFYFSLANIAKSRLISEYGGQKDQPFSVFARYPLISGQCSYFYHDFSSQYPYNLPDYLINDWLEKLKHMQNFFSGFGDIRTQDIELNQLSFQLREKLKAYQKLRQFKHTFIFLLGKEEGEIREIEMEFNDRIAKKRCFWRA